MKKRLVSILMCASLTAMLIAGCSGGDSNQGGNSSDSNTQTTSETETEDGDEETDTSNSSVKGSGGAFDEFERPKLIEDGKLKIACIHPKPEVESQKRSIIQCELEAENRGWEFQDIVYPSDAEWADLFKNVMNQGVDAIILGSTESMEAKVDLIQEARNAGIGVYSNDNQVVPGVIMNSTMPNGIAAMNLMYQIGNDIGWSGKIGFSTMATIQVHQERVLPMQAICDVYANLATLDTIDSTAGGTDQATYVGDAAKALFQKNGTDMRGFIGSCDYIAMPVVEAAQQNPDLVHSDFFVAGIDGGSDVWSYIRGGTYYKYNYAQPFEMFTHKVFEAIDQIQVQGLNPGDDGCILEEAGEVLYTEGIIVTPDNVPEVGANINSIFDYYTDDADEWYNWDGTYSVGE